MTVCVCVYMFGVYVYLHKGLVEKLQELTHPGALGLCEACPRVHAELAHVQKASIV